jgi:hypothetical protein
VEPSILACCHCAKMDCTETLNQRDEPTDSILMRILDQALPAHI